MLIYYYIFKLLDNRFFPKPIKLNPQVELSIFGIENNRTCLKEKNLKREKSLFFYSIKREKYVSLYIYNSHKITFRLS